MRRTIVAIVFQNGGIGDCGRHAILHAVKNPAISEVRAVARDPSLPAAPEPAFDKFTEAEKAKLQFITADPENDYESLREAFHGATAVISSLGCRQPGFERYGTTGMRTVVRAMQAQGVSRLVAMSSIGIGNSWPVRRMGPWWMGYLFGLFAITMMRGGLRDIAGLEKVVTDTQAGPYPKLDYVLVRPVGLGPEVEPQGTWTVREDPKAGALSMQIAKSDVGQFLVDQALNPTIHNQAIEIGSGNGE